MKYERKVSRAVFGGRGGGNHPSETQKSKNFHLSGQKNQKFSRTKMSYGLYFLA